MLFSESNSRYVVEVKPGKYDEFAKLMLNLPFGQVGKVVADGKLTIRDKDGISVIDLDLDCLKDAWQKPLMLS